MRKFLQTIFFALGFLAVSSQVQAQCASVINGQGSTLQAPWSVPLAATYSTGNTYTVTYNTNAAETGSGNGIAQLQSGATFWGGTDVPPTCAQQTVNPGNRILTFPVAGGATVIGYNLTGVPLDPSTGAPTAIFTLSSRQLAEIFTGGITNWNQIAQPDGSTNFPYGSFPITVVVRSDSSGDTGNYTTYLSDTQPLIWTTPPGNAFPTPYPNPNFVGASGNGGEAAAIKAHDGSVGYLAWNFAVTNSITQAAINSSANPTTYVQASTATIEAAFAGICIPFDLNITGTIDSSNAGSYPISFFTNMIAYEYYPTACDACEVANWIYYAATTGQASLSTFNLVPLPAAVQAQVINNLDFIKMTGTGNFDPSVCPTPVPPPTPIVVEVTNEVKCKDCCKNKHRRSHRRR